MFITIINRNTCEKIILKINSFDLDNFVELFEIVNNLSDFDFHFEQKIDD